MRRPFQLLTCLLLCLHLCGGPLGLLQAVAWTGMAVSYSRQEGVVEGMKKTFDGEHPCEMCQSIAKTREQPASSEPDQPRPPKNKLPEWAKVAKEFAWPDETALPAVTGRDREPASWPGVVLWGGTGTPAPPTPPPRVS